MDYQLSRRSVLLKMIGLVTASGLVFAKQSFGFWGSANKTPTGHPQDSNGNVTLSLSSAECEPLRSVGGSIKVAVQGTKKPVILIRSGDDTFTALSSKCTHLGCEVELPVNEHIVCHCHNSVFREDGSVVKGPASKKLPSYPVHFSGDVIRISMAEMNQ